MDKKTIQHIAKLSNFKITDQELAKYEKDLTGICQILDTVKNLDISSVEPMVSPLDTKFKSREDIQTKQDKRDVLKSFACEVEDDYFMVPQVIK